jgi:hypothetical protein
VSAYIKDEVVDTTKTQRYLVHADFQVERNSKR